MVAGLTSQPIKYLIIILIMIYKAKMLMRIMAISLEILVTLRMTRPVIKNKNIQIKCQPRGMVSQSTTQCPNQNNQIIIILQKRTQI